MSEIEPITREEMLLNAIAGEGSSEIEPVTRQEHYLSAIAGETDLPAGMEPITREEIYYQKILDNGGAGGGGEAEGTKIINITSNGTTSHNVKAYATAQIITNVPNPSTGTKQISQNGTHDVTDFASAQVDVPNSYGSSDEGKVVSGGALVAQTSRSVTSNGTIDTTLNREVNVNVSNSYSSSDEGKVVDNGALVAQTSQSITENGTYDTTTKNSVNVAVPQGITPSGSQTFTENGTYNVTSLAEAVVNVASSGGGMHTEEGYIELSDTNVGNIPGITIPVDLTSATGFILNLYVAETGEVSDGVVTKYTNIEVPTAFSSTAIALVYNYMLKYPQNPNPSIYRDDTNLISSRVANNITYNHAYRGNNGSNIALNANPTITAQGLTVSTGNGTRFFGHTGAYTKFKYEIKWW